MLANGSATSCPKPLPLPIKEVNKMKRPEIAASYKLTSAPPNSSKKRKLTSDVWNHFIKETDQNGMVRAKCKHCGKPFSGSSKDGTTHLKNHLNSSKCKRSQKETGGLENPTVTNGNFVFDEERSGLDLVRMIFKHGYPLNMVEHEDFKIFVKKLQPTFKLPSQDTLKEKILRVNREEKLKLRKQFDKLLSFSLILNFWTDCGKKNKYCSFTLQFIEDGPKLMKKNIAIKNVEYNYTGETLFEIVKGVLLEWNIVKKLASITVECSYANNQMVKILDRWLGDQGNCHPFRKQIFHIRCITRLINLLVKSGLDKINYILHKIRKAIKYMSETAIGKQKFEEAVKELNLGGKDITSESICRRWDSTFFLLQIALELRGEIYIHRQSINISMVEWDKAEFMCKCLSVFYDAICSFFGSKCLSTNVYFSKIVETCGSLLRLRESDIAKKMGMTFAPYFDFCTLVPAMAAVFDPRTNLKFVHYCFRYLYGDCTKLPTVIDGALSHMFGLYAKDLCSQGLSSSFPNNDNSSSSYGDNPCNILERWKKSQSSQMTQLDQYLREPPLHSDGELDILGWWHSKCQDSPALWAMARDILAIPMSTSTSNFAFCIETTTLDPIFNDLDPDIIEALFCGKDWLDNPIRITSNKDNDHSIANPEPMLENPGSTSGPEPLQTGDTLHVWSGTLEPQEAQSLSIICFPIEINCTMQLHHFLHKFFYIFNFLHLFNIFFI
ncbi:zinc finger BED domain-containing protein RICESLEEPER 1-like [Quercus suber]|uniref:zinc finger BED domain-containing protein RICESLEEPER 1-like n=1 Tax=Quercus suber TaxID=58331 RepID=UPI0032E010DC